MALRVLSSAPMIGQSAAHPLSLTDLDAVSGGITTSNMSTLALRTIDELPPPTLDAVPQMPELLPPAQVVPVAREPVPQAPVAPPQQVAAPLDLGGLVAALAPLITQQQRVATANTVRYENTPRYESYARDDYGSRGYYGGGYEGGYDGGYGGGYGGCG